MNSKQASLMRWLDSLWENHERAAGRPADRHARLAFYAKVTGRTVTSSKQLTNPQVTAIKRRVLALAQPDNFNAQMKSQVDNDPVQVRTAFLQRCTAAACVLKPDSELNCQRGFEQPRRSDYLAAIGRDKFGRSHLEMDNDELRRFTFAMEARAAARSKRDAERALAAAIAAGEAADRPVPQTGLESWDGEI